MAAEAPKSRSQQEKILGEFQNLRNEQKIIATKLNTLEMDLKEHKTVIETLKTVDESRKCFRLIGGVLCERTVKDVLPQLMENREMIEKTCHKLSEELQKKGTELNKYKELHNIRFQGEQIVESKNEQKQSSEDSAQTNVLVST